ncbi:threonine/serine ThrE exporter family protein (plasmid) [Streptomyces sp. BI20]|uniref:threonine/serine ThrE exporter family protein n=1 Tax=Streptomyces sp. BI20 TaxID=3403460 RepID=UPI003C76F972
MRRRLITRLGQRLRPSREDRVPPAPHPVSFTGEPLLFRRRRQRQADTVTLPARVVDEPEWAQSLADVLCRLGELLLRSGAYTGEVTNTIDDVAARYGMQVRSFIVPTGLLVRLGTRPGGHGGVIDFMPVPGQNLRLDQVQRLHDLVRRMRGEALPLDEAHAELRRVRELPRQTSAPFGVLGYVILTIGLGMIQHATLPALPGYAVLGLGVGVLREIAKRYPALATLLPVVAAAGATAACVRWAGPLLHEQPTALLIAPLIAFLPGTALTMGAIELATGAMLSGIARLAGAANVLLLLALGILIGTSVGGSHPPTGAPPALLGSWAVWTGVLLLGLGFIIRDSAPRAAAGWVLAALLLERAVQLASGHLEGPLFGAFAAGVTLPPLAAYIARRTRIPNQVIFLPSFWMLVPGSLGLKGVSDLLLTRTTNDIGVLITAVLTVLAIALGVLVGANLLRQTKIEVSPYPPPDDPPPVRE